MEHVKPVREASDVHKLCMDHTEQFASFNQYGCSPTASSNSEFLKFDRAECTSSGNSGSLKQKIRIENVRVQRTAQRRLGSHLHLGTLDDTNCGLFSGTLPSAFSPSLPICRSPISWGRPHLYGSTNSDDDTAIPDNIAAAFLANSKSPSPSKKAKSAKSAGSSKTSTVLHTKNIKTISKLPAKCAVTEKTLQDPLLYTIYRKLPPLSKGVFVSWSSGAGPGNLLFGQWPQVCPDIDVRISTLPVIHRYIETETGQSVVQWKHVVLTYNILVGLYFERLVGFVCMAFHVKTLHAQIHCDAITFGTRSFSKNNKHPLATASAKFSRGIPSSATKTASSMTFSSDDALSWEDEVPIYDGRKTAFNFSDDVNNLDNESNESEIPNSSCVAVAYTVSHYSSSSKDSVYFNIRFVVVISTPDEEGEEEEESVQKDGDDGGKGKAEVERTNEDETSTALLYPILISSYLLQFRQ
ncbi:hypothetical protein B0H11DRAFT_2413861 [Mycena galericulata]|nr:hypothetical protein B0H11DRAFT_2413861 [Mycena galericulata]